MRVAESDAPDHLQDTRDSGVRSLICLDVGSRTGKNHATAEQLRSRDHVPPVPRSVSSSLSRKVSARPVQLRGRPVKALLRYLKDSDARVEAIHVLRDRPERSQLNVTRRYAIDPGGERCSSGAHELVGGAPGLPLAEHPIEVQRHCLIGRLPAGDRQEHRPEALPKICALHPRRNPLFSGSRGPRVATLADVTCATQAARAETSFSPPSSPPSSICRNSPGMAASVAKFPCCTILPRLIT